MRDFATESMADPTTLEVHLHGLRERLARVKRDRAAGVGDPKKHADELLDLSRSIREASNRLRTLSQVTRTKRSAPSFQISACA